VFVNNAGVSSERKTSNAYAVLTFQELIIETARRWTLWC